MKSCTGIVSVSCDLKEYNPASLKSGGSGSAGGSQRLDNPSYFNMKPINSQDIVMALNEVLPLVSETSRILLDCFNVILKVFDTITYP